MLSTRLIQLMEDHADGIAAELVDKVRDDLRASHYSRLSDSELLRRSGAARESRAFSG